MNLISPGLHHVTAMCGHPQTNIDFYAGILGLRLVKVTVNFDAPDTYHLYYGDGLGRPGTLMTFFPWESSQNGHVGKRQVGVTAFGVPKGSLDFWQKRLEQHDVSVLRDKRFDEGFLSFADRDGLLLELVETEDAGPGEGWLSEGITESAAIRGFHHVELWLENHEPTAEFLKSVFGMTEGPADVNRFRMIYSDGRAGSTIDLMCLPGRYVGTTGKGTVHHVAFRVQQDTDHEHWQAKVRAEKLHPTPVQDRRYFKSIYFREPGGVLFEMATDAPGFTRDEDESVLGEKLCLPEWLEPKRAMIRAHLTQITHPSGKVIT